MKTALEYIVAALVVLLLSVDGWGCRSRRPDLPFRADPYAAPDGGAP